ncbi:hypothetical protein H5410_021371 [Solanum commersonii]|uniref:Uncharacterized protein n=1 Tax=Solanum commersonii TaxID=4109 RepID=A0A9J5ZBS3_SOLCO|nr:hypothetical protein H5410_021371 [Solanum commersonii]
MQQRIGSPLRLGIIDKKLFKEFKEPSRKAIIVFCPREMTKFIMNLRRKKGAIPEARGSDSIMPPQRVARGRLARRKVDPKNLGVPNAPEVQPQG